MSTIRLHKVSLCSRIRSPSEAVIIFCAQERKTPLLFSFYLHLNSEYLKIVIVVFVILF
jgi:hypothetical protein